MGHSVRHPKRLALVGAVLCLAALALVILAPQPALKGWLAASVTVSSIPIGAVLLVMMMRLIPGAWDEDLMVFGEAAMFLLPFAAVTFLPVLLGMGSLYEWAQAPAHNAFQSVYLSPAFFALRTLLWFAALMLTGWLLIARRARSTRISSAGLIGLVAFSTLIATDWLQSLDPRFHSSGFGLYTLAMTMQVALLFLIIASLVTHGDAARSALFGALMLTSLLLWAYLAFMQYFISWSNNLPDPIAWYQRRGTLGWSAVYGVVMVLSLVPLLLLITTPLRTHKTALLVFAAAALLARALEFAWLVLPGDEPTMAVAWVAWLLASAGQGTLLAALYPAALRRRVAQRRPRAAMVRS